MSFVSFAFVGLLALALIARLVFHHLGLRGPFFGALILASVVFYGWHVPSYLALIVFSTVVDYVAGARIVASGTRERQRRLWLILSLVANLGVLGFFKYADFAMDEVQRLGAWLGLGDWVLPHLGIALPIGISFYTFHSMSYTIDVYRRRIEPVARFRDLFLFVSFFPQLVAGPIVRARDFLYQLERPRPPRLVVWMEGI